MLQMTWWGWLKLLAVFSLLMFFGFHLAAFDVLLFSSDFFSLVIYSSAIILVLTAIFTLLILPLRWFSPHKQRWLFFQAHMFGAWVVVMVFLMVVVQWGAVRFKLLDLTGEYAVWVLGGGLLLFMLLATVLVYNNPQQEHMVQSVSRLGGAVLIVCSGALVVGFSRHWVNNLASSLKVSRQLALIIVDGLPASHLQSMNPTASRTALDDVIENGLLFTNVQTAVPSTNPWFGALYLGSPKTAFHLPEDLSRSPNLLSLLQDNGVVARWIVSHRNSIPEVSSARLKNYQGLRSVFLGTRTKWIAERMGLNYHYAIQDYPTHRIELINKLRSLRNWWANDQQAYGNIFTGLLIPELRQLRATAIDSAVIFHLFLGSVGLDDIPQAFDSAVKNTHLADITADIRKNSNRYNPEDTRYAPLIQSANKLYAEGLDLLGHKLAEFLRILQSDPELSNTGILLTADHGTVFDKGRAWYGYHPVDEVVRVPVVLLNAGQSGRDSRLFSTPDITATMLDFFGIMDSLNPNALSMIGQGSHEWVATVTQNDAQHKEWFLVLREAEEKYVINISPEGNGEVTVYRGPAYQEPVTADKLALPERLFPAVETSLQEFGITEEVYQLF